MVSRPLVITGESSDLIQISERCELILASESSPWELERPEQGCVKTAGPQQRWVPRYLPGCRTSVSSEDSLGRSEEYAGVYFAFAGLLLVFCASSPSTSTAACAKPRGLVLCVFGGKISACKREAQFCPDHVQTLPLLSNTQA